jgi:hypothetical protein
MEANAQINEEGIRRLLYLLQRCEKLDAYVRKVYAKKGG